MLTWISRRYPPTRSHRQRARWVPSSKTIDPDRCVEAHFLGATPSRSITLGAWRCPEKLLWTGSSTQSTSIPNLLSRWASTTLNVQLLRVILMHLICSDGFFSMGWLLFGHFFPPLVIFPGVLFSGLGDAFRNAIPPPVSGKSSLLQRLVGEP